MGDRVRYRILGPLEIKKNGQWVPIAAARLRSLLAILLVNANRVVAVERLLDELWGAQPPRTHAKPLQMYVSRVRRELDDHDGERLVTRPPGYLLAVEPSDLDALQFEALASEGTHALGDGDADGAVVALEKALRLWRGDVLADVPASPAIASSVVRLAEGRLVAVRALIDARLVLGQAAEVLGELQSLVGRYPFNEGFWARLLVALFKAGRQAEALDAYRVVRRRLIDELGVEPGDELMRSYQGILHGGCAQAGMVTSGPAVVPDELPAAIPTFAGRRRELDRLTRLLDEAQPIAVTSAVICGMAGVGKTALAVHWAQHVAERFPDGHLYVDLRGAAVRPVEMLPRVLRSFGISRDQVPADEEEQAAACRTLLTRKRVLMLLDGVRTAEQVCPLLPGQPGSFVLITSRQNLAGLAATDDTYLMTVHPLQPDEAAELVTRTLGHGGVTASSDAVAALAQLCGYLPLALRIAAALVTSGRYHHVSELVDRLREGDRVSALAIDGDRPVSVRAAFDLSYRDVGRQAQLLFRRLGLTRGSDVAPLLAAVLIGASFGVARHALAELAAEHLVEETAAGRYRVHDLLQEYARQRATSDGRDDRSAAVIPRRRRRVTAGAQTRLNESFAARDQGGTRMPDETIRVELSETAPEIPEPTTPAEDKEETALRFELSKRPVAMCGRL